jgi:hypothetical protein
MWPKRAKLDRIYALASYSGICGPRIDMANMPNTRLPVRRPISFVKASDASVDSAAAAAVVKRVAGGRADESRAIYESVLRDVPTTATRTDSAELSAAAAAGASHRAPATAATTATGVSASHISSPRSPSRTPACGAAARVKTTVLAGSEILAAAEADDVATLSRCRPGDIITTRDGYGWTPLMVAAAAGAAAAVEYILDVVVADVCAALAFAGVMDARGHDAIALSRARGHTVVTSTLTRSLAAWTHAATSSSLRNAIGGGRTGRSDDDDAYDDDDDDDDDDDAEGDDGECALSDRTISPAASDDEDVGARSSTDNSRGRARAAVVPEPTNVSSAKDGDGRALAVAAAKSGSAERSWCDACKAFYSTSATLHTQTIPHRIACQPPDLSTPFSLTARNKGFQMLVQAGWDARSGLGPDGEGRLVPVKTVLKRDLRGIGVKTKESQLNAKESDAPKVTHFVAGDVSAVRTATASAATQAHGKRNLSASSARYRAPSLAHAGGKRRRVVHTAGTLADKHLREMLSDGPAHDYREGPEDPTWE